MIQCNMCEKEVSKDSPFYCEEHLKEFEKNKTDMVNHPPHYTSHPSGIECIDVVKHMNYCLGNAIKYIWRAGLKGDKVEDLKKAKQYISFEIERIENEK